MPSKERLAPVGGARDLNPGVTWPTDNPPSSVMLASPDSPADRSASFLHSDGNLARKENQRPFRIAASHFTVSDAS